MMKRMLSALLAAVMLISVLAGLSGCGEQSGKTGAEGAKPTQPAGDQTDYTVTVRTAGGMAMPGLDILIYSDSTLADLKDAAQTDEGGTVTFRLPAGPSYVAVVSGAPKGYQVEASYPFVGTDANIMLNSSLVTDAGLSGASLGVGDVMYDFTVTTPDGTSVKLSEVLAQKKMVLVNFWYTTCTYCVAEFPYMQQAYEKYSDDVGIIAINPLEKNAAVAPFQEQYGLSFPMAECPAAWSATFGVQGYPTSVIIDRYGVITLIEEGGITSLRPFVSLFETMTRQDYEQKLYTSIGELVTRIEPSFQMDSSENIAAIMNDPSLAVAYRPEADDAYSWPFIQTEKNGEVALKASNQQIDDSYAILYMDVELKAGQALGFDYLISSEFGSDLLHVIVDDQPIYSISGVAEEEVWESCYPWVAQADGTYEVALCYIKDGSNAAGDDTVYMKNVRAVDAQDVDVETYIPRYAATTQDEFEYEYAQIVLNEKDGYYHVGSENGPLLLADLMNTTQFNEEASVWAMTDQGMFVLDGKDHTERLTKYCSYASNSALSGVCTVNEELAQLLKVVAQIAGFDGTENEWLKLCKYYEAYGTKGNQLVDPIQGLADFSAYKATEGVGIPTNSVTYNRPIMPRGLISKFVPKRSGVYRITSDTTEQMDVEGWIFDENMQIIMVYEQCERTFDYGDDVSMVMYMEAGKTYYIDLCFWDVYQTGTITYDIKYLGASVELFRTCAPGYFTYDSDATGDAMYYLITAGIDVVLRDDGFYYEDLGKDANGKQRYGSKIYVDFVGTSGVFSTPVTTVPAYKEDGSVARNDKGEPIMVTGMIDLGGFDFSKSENDMYVLSFLKQFDGDVEKTDAHLRELWGAEYDAYAQIYLLEDVYEGKYHGTGPDLTEEIRGYADKMISGSGAMGGCVAVDQRLAEILQLLMDKYTFENVENSWLKMCYYYDRLG